MSHKKSFWDNLLSNWEKPLYIFSFLIGIPLGIWLYWDETSAINSIVGGLIATPLFVAFITTILCGWIKAVFSFNKDADEKEISIGVPITFIVIGIVSKNTIVTMVGIALGIIALFTWRSK